jgi:hypothetical protein
MNYQAKARRGEGWRLLGRERRAGRQAHKSLIFDRHAKLPIASGSVPLKIGSDVPVHHNGARPRSRAPECESAAPGPSRHDVVPAHSSAQLHCHEPTTIALTSPASQRQGQTHPAGTAGRTTSRAGYITLFP